MTYSASTPAVSAWFEDLPPCVCVVADSMGVEFDVYIPYSSDLPFYCDWQTPAWNFSCAASQPAWFFVFPALCLFAFLAGLPVVVA